MVCDLQAETSADTPSDTAKKTGAEILGMGCDVTGDDDIEAVADAAVMAFGGVFDPEQQRRLGRAPARSGRDPPGRAADVPRPEPRQRLSDEHGPPAISR